MIFVTIRVANVIRKGSSTIVIFAPIINFAIAISDNNCGQKSWSLSEVAKSLYFLFCRKKMKHLMVGLILISAISLAVKTNGYHVENDIKNNPVEEFLENFKTILRNGNDTWGIPILDPFTMDEIPIALHEGIINMDALLNNVRVDGLSEYKVNKGEFTLIGLKLAVNLSWPLMIANTDYDMDGKVQDFEIYGKGKMKISPQDFSFDVIISFKVDGSYLQVKQMELKISLGAFDFHATGLFNFDDQMSEVLSFMVSEMAPQMLKENHDLIVEKAAPLIINFLNKSLCTITIQELLKLIGLGK